VVPIDRRLYFPIAVRTPAVVVQSAPRTCFCSALRCRSLGAALLSLLLSCSPAAIAGGEERPLCPMPRVPFLEGGQGSKACLGRCLRVLSGPICRGIEGEVWEREGTSLEAPVAPVRCREGRGWESASLERVPIAPAVSHKGRWNGHCWAWQCCCTGVVLPHNGFLFFCC